MWRNGVTGKPLADRNVFSRKRFCVVCSISPRGCTSTNSAAASTVADGTFSNSNVTTSTDSGERPDRVEISYEADVSISATCPGRRVALRRKRVNTIAHLTGLDREHTSELAAAEHANG